MDHFSFPPDKSRNWNLEWTSWPTFHSGLPVKQGANSLLLHMGAMQKQTKPNCGWEEKGNRAENAHLRNQSPCQEFNCQIINSDSGLFIARLRHMSQRKEPTFWIHTRLGFRHGPHLLGEWLHRTFAVCQHLCFLICQRRLKLFYNVFRDWKNRI